ncbi:MAG: hypothetical protein F9K44_11720 [Hyphomicrobiaceae bacterium]|nr:MAG: hypothetical protein F9K44_11720 [Hyphomicrobiaceae bacterium]
MITKPQAGLLCTFVFALAGLILPTAAQTASETAPQPSEVILQKVRKASEAAKTKYQPKPVTEANANKTEASPVTTSAIKTDAEKKAVADKPRGRCTKLAFAVNDYGKQGPAKDAQALLDKHIADWAQRKGIRKYSIGKKTVKCKLFLDFGVFDEHTCTATAPVCW